LAKPGDARAPSIKKMTKCPVINDKEFKKKERVFVIGGSTPYVCLLTPLSILFIYVFMLMTKMT
jgi:hypothetical protein